MTTLKPRELWLKRWKDDKFNFHQTELCKVDPKSLSGVDCNDFKDSMHVIEYSAYNQAVYELDKSRDSHMKKITDLAAKLAIAVEALEHYESAHYDNEGYTCNRDKTAREALAKAREVLGE